MNHFSSIFLTVLFCQVNQVWRDCAFLVGQRLLQRLQSHARYELTIPAQCSFVIYEDRKQLDNEKSF